MAQQATKLYNFFIINISYLIRDYNISDGLHLDGLESPTVSKTLTDNIVTLLFLMKNKISEFCAYNFKILNKALGIGAFYYSLFTLVKKKLILIIRYGS